MKKILPFLLVAIVFAVGGYFVGQGSMSDQGAALYNAKTVASQTGKTIETGTTGPTNPGVPPSLADLRKLLDSLKLSKTDKGPTPRGYQTWLDTDTGCLYLFRGNDSIYGGTLLGCWFPTASGPEGTR